MQRWVSPRNKNEIECSLLSFCRLTVATTVQAVSCVCDSSFATTKACFSPQTKTLSADGESLENGPISILSPTPEVLLHVARGCISRKTSLF